MPGVPRCRERSSVVDGRVLVFDVETQLLASEVAEKYAVELNGESPWSRPDLFGFAVGVVEDVSTGVVYRYGPESAKAMIEHLREADVTAGYNSEAFDLGVLSAYGDVSGIKGKHVDLNVRIRDALAALTIDRRGMGRLRQGGLDGLCKANGIVGKTGSGIDAPTLFREGRIEELLNYCAADVRATTELYRLVRDTGKLRVEPFLRRGKKRVELGAIELPVKVS